MTDQVRRATAADLPRIEAVTDAAYRPYIERIGVRPAPMRADHAANVAAGRVFVTGTPAVGVLVLVPHSDHLLVESVAVHPDAQGTGLGRLLLDFAEQHAQETDLTEIQLYTHALMWENQRLYARYGYQVVARRTEGDHDRIHYRKPLR